MQLASETKNHSGDSWRAGDILAYSSQSVVVEKLLARANLDAARKDSRERFMSLQSKTALIIGGMLIAAGIFVLAVSHSFLLDSFARLDESRVASNVERGLDALADRVNYLDAIASDWAAWDDTYAFIEDGNEEYISANLVDGTFVTLNLNLMLFINSAGQIVFARAFDLENETETALPAGLQEHVSTSSLLLQHDTLQSSLKGIILLPNGPMLVASRPILTSDEQGPIRGTLVMGRYLDQAEVAELAALTHTSITISRLGEIEAPPGLHAVNLSVPEKPPAIVRPLDDDTIAGYAAIKDIYGKPAVVLRVDMPREIYAYGVAAVRYLILFLIAIGFITGIAGLILVHKLILSRLAQLGNSVHTISKRGDMSVRLPVTGNDEISQLALNINQMLDELGRSQVLLQESEQKYRTILDDMEEAYVETDVAGNVTFFNDYFQKVLGRSSEELMGMNYRALVGEEDIKPLYYVSNKVYRTGQPARVVSFRFLRQDGSAGFFEVSIYPRRSQDGEIVGFRLLGHDITERKKAEQQLLMTSKLASIGELTAGIAHELNNPLTGVIGYAQLLMDAPDVPPQVKSDLEKIYQESQRAAKIVHNLLSFARQRQPEKHLVDVNELIQKTLEMRSYRLVTSNIELHLELQAGLPRILADYHQLQQVLLNILVNAEQALAEVKHQGKIWLSSSAGHEYVTISIRDNGPGIPKSNITRIFDPFFTTKEVGKGTGLGLSVCHGIITAHGGNIYVDSRVGKGATFTIELPIVSGESAVLKDKDRMENS